MYRNEAESWREERERVAARHARAERRAAARKEIDKISNPVDRVIARILHAFT